VGEKEERKGKLPYLQVEFVESVVVAMSMHVHRIDTELVSAEAERLKDLVEGELLTVTEADDLVGGVLHLGLDEPEQLLLVHRGRVVDVGVDLVVRHKRRVREKRGEGQLHRHRMRIGGQKEGEGKERKGRRRERKERESRTFRTL
jgi:hypothetical protein